MNAPGADSATPVIMGSRLRGNDRVELPRVDMHTSVALPEILAMALFGIEAARRTP